MAANERIPSMTELIGHGEAETVKRARDVFRSSLVLDLEGVLGYANLAKLEAWFINRALAAYKGKMGGEIYLENGLTVLNTSAWLAGLDLYEKSMLGLYNRLGNWRMAWTEMTMRKLKQDIRKAEATIAEYPDRLERLRQLNVDIEQLVDSYVRPVTGGVGETLGGVGGFGVMVTGMVGGAVGYVSGRVARRVFEFVRDKMARLLVRIGSGGKS